MNNLPVCLPCDGIKDVTPLPIFNRPDLSALKYRIGSHGTFFESLLARISTLTIEELGDLSRTVNEQSHRRLTGQTKLASQVEHPLRDLLTTREKTDPSIALLDAWSTLADVLTFYQERIANEGFLRTAQERRSIEKLARLTGYRLRPGVSSTVYLAFEVDDTALQPNFGNGQPSSELASPVLIPRGTAAKSTPTPGSDQEPQTFETSKDFWGRKQWNALQLRASRPHLITDATVENLDVLYLQGTGLRLNANDYLGISYDASTPAVLHRIVRVDEVAANNTTKVELHLDELSPQRLMSALALVARSFPSSDKPPRAEESFVPAQIPAPGEDPYNFESIRKKLPETLKVLNQLSAAPSQLTLIRIDSAVHEIICGAGNIRSLATTFTDAAKKLANGENTGSAHYDGLNVLLDSSSIRTDFVGAVGRLIEKYRDKDLLLRNLADLIESGSSQPPASRQAIIANIRLLLRDVAAGQRSARFGCGSLPQVFTPPGTDSGLSKLAVKIDGTSPTKFRADVIVVRGNDPGPSTAIKLKLPASSQFDITVAGFTLTITPKPGQPSSLSELASALLQSSWSDGKARDVAVSFYDTDGSSPLFLGIAVQRTMPESGTDPTYLVSPQNASVLVPNDGSKTPLRISCKLLGTAPAPAPRYSAKISLFSAGPIAAHELAGPTTRYALSPDGMFRQDPSVLTNATFDEFARELSEHVSAKAVRPSGMSQLLIQIFNTNAQLPGDCIASGTLDVLTIDASQDTIDTSFAAVLSDTHGSFGDAEVADTTCAYEFKHNTFPRTGSDNAETAGESLYGTSDSLNVDLAIPSLKSVADKTQTRLLKWAAIGPLRPWEDRLKQFRQDVAAIAKKEAESIYSPGTSPSGILQAARTAVAIDGSLAQACQIQGPPVIDIEPLMATLLNVRTKVAISLPTATSNPIETLAIWSKAIQDLKDRLVATVIDLLALQKWLTDVTDDFAKAVLQALAVPRMVILNLVNSSLVGQNAALLAAPNGLAGVEKDVSSWLNDTKLRFERGTTVLASDPPLKDWCKCTEGQPNDTKEAGCFTIAKTVEHLRAQLDGTASPTGLVARNLTLALPSFSGEKRELLSGLMSSLKRLLRRVAPTNPAGTGTTTNPSADVQTGIAILEQIQREADSMRRGQLTISLLELFNRESDLIVQLARVLSPPQRDFLYGWLQSARIGPPLVFEPKVFVFRSKANLFGWSGSVDVGTVIEAMGKVPELACVKTSDAKTREVLGGLLGAPGEYESEKVMFLDGEFRQTIAGSTIAFLRKGQAPPNPVIVKAIRFRPRTAYGIKNNATEIEFVKRWWPSDIVLPVSPRPIDSIMDFVRSTKVLCDAEQLTLAEAAEPETIAAQEEVLECDRLVEELTVGHDLILEGQSSLIAESVSSKPVLQKLQITDIDHRIDRALFGDTFKTLIRITPPLQQPLKRSSVRIFANVVEATHGETQRETLGSGNAAVEFQKFLLKRADVSQLVAPTVTGVKSALAVRVNDVEWEERPDLKEAGRLAEQFVTRTDDAQQTVVVFGDGVNGARVPTGVENVRAEYRTGLGRKGNVGPGQISQLLGAPLGVKKVNNPLAARGGADPESRDDARAHAPLAVTAMDRLVSVQDFADFAMTYAGIGKASASLLQGTVHVTIAGLDPEPLGADNPLYRNLQQAMSLFGDPSQQFSLHDREASLLILIAKVKIDPKRQWEIVQPKIREALLQRFHYDRSDLGQDLLLSDAIATIQKVEGVLYVDVDKFDAVRQQDVSSLATRLGSLQRRPRIRVNLARVTSENAELAELGLSPEEDKKMKTQPAAIRPTTASGNPNGEGDGTSGPVSRDQPIVRAAQLCYLTPDIPDTLILEAVR